MKTFIFVFFVTAIFNLIPNWAQSAITGSQCQSHLAEVTDILKRENLASYWRVNDDIVNVLGISLNVISRTSSQDPAVQDFVGSVATTVSECQTHCGGVVQKSGKQFSCKELANKTILDVKNIIANIDGHFTGPETETEAVSFESVPSYENQGGSQDTDPCARGMETDSCQVFLDELENKVHGITTKATLASHLPECSDGRENTDTCQVLLDEIFNRQQKDPFPASDSVSEESVIAL